MIAPGGIPFTKTAPAIPAAYRTGRFSAVCFAVICASVLTVVPLPCAALTVSSGPVQDYLFTEGKKHYDAGDMHQAEEAWRHLFPDKVYGPPAYLLLARSYRKARNVQKAEELLKELLKGHSGGIYQEVIREELADILCDQGKPEAVEMLQSMISMASDKKKPALVLRIAQLQRRIGDHSKATAHYRTLFLNYPASVEGLKAADDLSWMVFHGKIQRLEFSETEQISRAEKLFTKGRFDLAADAYQAVLKIKPADTGLLLKLAQCRYKDRQNQKAIDLLKEVLKANPPDKQRMEALHILSLLYWRLDREKDFEFCSAKIMEKGSDKQKRKTLFNLGAYYMEKGKYAQAESHFNRLTKMSLEASAKTDVKWKAAWIKYWNKQYKEAAEAFREARTVSPGGKIEPASKYWQARALELSGRSSEAQALLKEIAAACPLDYYGIEAARLLKRQNIPLNDKKASSPFPNTDLSPAESSSELVSTAVKLMEHKLYEFALLNLAALPKSTKSTPAVAFLMAKAAYGAERYRTAQEILAVAFGPFMENPPPNAPKEFIEMAFPRVHFNEATRTAQKHAVDPHLVWAIIRQESRYDASVVSPAGAIGLMQVTPAAAGVPRKGGKIPATAIAEILEPKANLGHGIRILAKNLEAFKGKIIPAVASYNADIRKVRDWIRRNGKMKQDEFIENIPYLETRIYVKKVLAGYSAYSLLHRQKDLAGLW
ncbi:MAG: transglycosylase SLT domain-containing protein [Desulfomonile tiedjei]|nr:transglycosylase SLT domain-containing protein [Desulfomonile tiedjei]